MPHKYDRRPDNFFAQVHNFIEMNKEHPFKKPITTGYPFTDFMMKSALKKIHPLISYATNAYNFGYQGAGYYDNWQQAKEAGKYKE